MEYSLKMSSYTGGGCQCFTIWSDRNLSVCSKIFLASQISLIGAIPHKWYCMTSASRFFSQQIPITNRSQNAIWSFEICSIQIWRQYFAVVGMARAFQNPTTTVLFTMTHVGDASSGTANHKIVPVVIMCNSRQLYRLHIYSRQKNLLICSTSHRINLRALWW